VKIDTGDKLVSHSMNVFINMPGTPHFSCQSVASEGNETIYCGHVNGSVSLWKLKSSAMTKIESVDQTGTGIQLLRLNSRINKLVVATMTHLHVYEAEQMNLLCSLDSGFAGGEIYVNPTSSGLQIFKMDAPQMMIMIYPPPPQQNTVSTHNYVQSGHGNEITHTLLPGSSVSISNT
jgi:hypothetical protein